jgi:hypothetical protein
MAFDQSGPRWLGISDLIAEPEGPTFISYKVARSLLNRLRFVTQDPERKSQGASSSSACEGTAMAIRLARELRTILPSGTLAWRLRLWLFRGKRPGRIALGSADT